MSFFDKWRKRRTNKPAQQATAPSSEKPLASVLRREPTLPATPAATDHRGIKTVNIKLTDHKTRESQFGNQASNNNNLLSQSPISHKISTSSNIDFDTPILKSNEVAELSTPPSLTASTAPFLNARFSQLDNNNEVDRKDVDAVAGMNESLKVVDRAAVAYAKIANRNTGQLRRAGNTDSELTIPTYSPEWHSLAAERAPESDELLDRHKLFNVSDEVLELVDPKFAKEQEVLPIELTGNMLMVVCAQRQSRRVAEHILQNQHPHLVLRFLYAPPEMIQAAIDHHYLRRDLKINEAQRAARYRQISTQIRQVNTGRRLTKHLIFSTNGQLSNTDTAIRELLENLLCDGHWARATDIDIDLFRRDRQNCQPGQPREFMVCRIRVDGEYQVIHEEPMELEKYERLPHVLKIYAGLDPNNTWDGQSGVVRPTLAYATRESAVEFRVNFIPAGEDRGESISIRVQERDNFTFSLDKVGLLPDQDAIVRQDIMRLTQGMVIFAGPINKGKNTSMVCLIKEFQTQFPTKKIITVEDPPEFNLPYVTQIAVGQQREEALAGPDKRAFKYYLKHILRHNPDIIVVGEVREPEPAQMAIETASIGHLVLTTMHTASAMEAVDRLRNFGIENYKIAGGVKAVIAQRLVKQICSACVPIPDPDIDTLQVDRLAEYIALLGWPTDTQFIKGSGRTNSGEECFQCRGKGFYNRLGIFEILTISREIRNLIGRGATPDEIRTQALATGFRSLWMSGLQRALEGRTTLTEVLYHIGRPDPFEEGLPELPQKNNVISDLHKLASLNELVRQSDDHTFVINELTKFNSLTTAANTLNVTELLKINHPEAAQMLSNGVVNIFPENPIAKKESSSAGDEDSNVGTTAEALDVPVLSY